MSMLTTPTICLEHINKSFGKNQILFDISLTIPEGCIYGLLGPSGCGKSTSVKIMAGISKQDSGKVYILGQEMPNLMLMSQIGYMSQSSALYPTLSGYENLKFFGSLYGFNKQLLQERIEYVSTLVNLTDYLPKYVSTYSGGMKQRLALAISLLANPKVLILDEPTVGIDPLLRYSIWEELYKLAEQKITILITTHVMDEAAKCHELAMMYNGTILAAGTPEQILEKAQVTNIEDAFIYFGKSHISSKEVLSHEN